MNWNYTYATHMSLQKLIELDGLCFHDTRQCKLTRQPSDPRLEIELLLVNSECPNACRVRPAGIFRNAGLLCTLCYESP